MFLEEFVECDHSTVSVHGNLSTSSNQISIHGITAKAKKKTMLLLNCHLLDRSSCFRRGRREVLETHQPAKVK